MYTGLLHLHNLLRWIILILLVVCIIKTFSKDKNTKVSKFLLIASHITLLLGLYQYFFGAFGIKLFQSYGSTVMKTASLRFWAVEHITGMILAITLITIGHISLKKTGNTKKTAILFTIALVLILAVVPWPFREGIGRVWFPGVH